MRRAADEGHLHDRRARRAEDHLPDRSRHVVDVTQARGEPAAVKRGCALQPHLFFQREEELEPGVRPLLLDVPTTEMTISWISAAGLTSRCTSPAGTWKKPPSSTSVKSLPSGPNSNRARPRSTNPKTSRSAW